MGVSQLPMAMARKDLKRRRQGPGEVAKVVTVFHFIVTPD